jgi:TPR repeat protein
MWDSEPDMEALRRLHATLSTDRVAALAGLKELADRGSMMSMVYIAHAYRKGTGIGVDLLQSNQWYRRAAAAGSVLASYELGWNYLEAKDYDKALEMFAIGAEKEYPPSMNALAMMYARGQGVPVNLNGARDLLEGAAAQGHLYAKANLASLLRRGKFGVWQRPRGFLLTFSSLKDLITIWRNPHSERLR